MSTPVKTPATSVLLAILVSLLVGSGHLLVKGGAERLRLLGWSDPLGLLLVAGSYALLGLAFVLFVVALRTGELSTIYPILSARYIWVVALTPWLFASESVNLYKIAGVSLAALGVVIVARAGTR
jgi:multidrug transporter EmrE-like cation transporter